MAVSKVLKCSRAFPYRAIDDFQSVTSLSGASLLIFVKFTIDLYDVLCYNCETSYFCRYQFPKRGDWLYVEDVVEYLKKEL